MKNPIKSSKDLPELNEGTREGRSPHKQHFVYYISKSREVNVFGEGCNTSRDKTSVSLSKIFSTFL